MTRTELARRIDHTILKPEAMPSEVHAIVAEAIEYRFACVCVAPIYVSRVATMLRGSGGAVKVASVAGFPHGTSKATIKAIEATSVIKDGADEVDLVAHLPNLLRCDVDAARAELIEIVRAARSARRDVTIKVIVESALMMDNVSADQAEQRIMCACRAVRESGCDYIKTATGFHPAGGASVEAVKLMKKHADALRVKAAGGIRDLAIAQAMLAAGADRIGCSASVSIIKQLAPSGCRTR